MTAPLMASIRWRSRETRALAATAISLSISLLPQLAWGEPSARSAEAETGSAGKLAAIQSPGAASDHEAIECGPRFDNTSEVNEHGATPRLPDVKSLIERQQLLKDLEKYKKCQAEASEIVDLQDLPPQVVNPDWSKLDVEAKRLGNFPAYADARAIFLKNRSLLKKKDSFSIAVYSMFQPIKRKIFIVDLVRSQIASVNIQHGRGSFQNAGPYRSSLGCFIGGADVKGFAFTLHGIDGALNNYACERRLQVHISQAWGFLRQPSFGCLTLQRGHNEAYRAVAAATSGGGLICAYDEGHALVRK